MTDKQTQVVVLGAGYAGVMAAVRLAGKTKKQNVSVTLINAADHFTERPRLHETATGRPPRQHPLADFLRGTTIQFRPGMVTSLDPDQQVVTIQTNAGSSQVGYDYLVYALGSHVDRDSVAGVRQHAYALDASGPLSAVPLHERLRTLAESGGRIAVVGSGATGIEAAAEIADCFPMLGMTLVTQGEFAAFMPAKIRAYMRGALERLGIQLLEQAKVSEVRATELVYNSLHNNDILSFELCIWAGGFRGLPLAREAGLQVNHRDQILADPLLRSLSHSTIYAAGDAVWPVRQPGAPLRMSLFTALVTAAHAADNLSRLLHEQEQRPLGFSYYGQGIALGRRDAVGFGLYPDDEPGKIVITGKAGLAIRNFFVWLLLTLLKIERRWPGFFFWLGRNRGRKDEGGIMNYEGRRMRAEG